jgi:hypothetical protein
VFIAEASREVGVAGLPMTPSRGVGVEVLSLSRGVGVEGRPMVPSRGVGLPKNSRGDGLPRGPSRGVAEGLRENSPCACARARSDVDATGKPRRGLEETSGFRDSVTPFPKDARGREQPGVVPTDWWLESRRVVARGAPQPRATERALWGLPIAMFMRSWSCQLNRP